VTLFAPHPEEPRIARRLEGWRQVQSFTNSWFETALHASSP
jgi:hypothetical protein